MCTDPLRGVRDGWGPLWGKEVSSVLHKTYYKPDISDNYPLMIWLVLRKIVAWLTALVSRGRLSKGDGYAHRVYLTDRRSETFAEVTPLEHLEADWVRCTRPEPSPRERLPTTTKYYHDSEIARISSEG